MPSTASIGGAAADATLALFLNGVLPDISNRIWTVARAAMLRPDGTLDRRRFWPVDTGDYRFSRAASCTAVAAAAIAGVGRAFGRRSSTLHRSGG